MCRSYLSLKSYSCSFCVYFYFEVDYVGERDVRGCGCGCGCGCEGFVDFLLLIREEYQVEGDVLVVPRDFRGLFRLPRGFYVVEDNYQINHQQE